MRAQEQHAAASQTQRLNRLAIALGFCEHEVSLVSEGLALRFLSMHYEACFLGFFASFAGG
jgi:hypothetical protein